MASFALQKLTLEHYVPIKFSTKRGTPIIIVQINMKIVILLRNPK